ncbi:MAG TPA: DUF1697 domain-containing protein [Symbiobacteriaceae bacterium]|nr:DUF1697 domain-containing protein [Symbiobacteriaceae bacterium]
MVYIALLRGINVGGHKLIKMADLKAMCEAMGLAQVQTYIQSGNVLFVSSEEAEPLRRRIEQQIQAVFGFDVPLALRTLAQWERIIAACPFPADDGLCVAVLAEAPTPEGIDRLLAHKIEEDELSAAGSEVYLLYRQPIHKSKLTTNLLEKRLGVPATVRNWQTMNKLAALGRAMAE